MHTNSKHYKGSNYLKQKKKYLCLIQRMFIGIGETIPKIKAFAPMDFEVDRWCDFDSVDLK